MKDDSDWYIEHVRRKALAEIKIAKELGKQKSLSENSATKPNCKLSKSGFGMKMLGIALTVVSVILVSSCFITTVDSYNMALVDTNNAGPNVAGGEVLNPLPRITVIKIKHNTHRLRATCVAPNCSA